MKVEDENNTKFNVRCMDIHIQRNRNHVPEHLQYGYFYDTPSTTNLYEMLRDFSKFFNF